MKVAIGLLCFDVFRTRRDQMLLGTLRTLAASDYPYTLHVVTNGSTDGTEQVVRDLGGIVDNTNSAIWFGMRTAIDACTASGADLVVFSADDLAYHPGWLNRLVQFWQAAPTDVKLATQFLEDCWDWNAISAAAEYGGQRCLFRDSVPGCSWSFRAKDWPFIGPLPEHTPGEDLEVCQRLRHAGYRLAALDLAEHVGDRHSAWGNQSWTYAKPLDRAAYGFPERNAALVG